MTRNCSTSSYSSYSLCNCETLADSFMNAAMATVCMCDVSRSVSVSRLLSEFEARVDVSPSVSVSRLLSEFEARVDCCDTKHEVLVGDTTETSVLNQLFERLLQHFHIVNVCLL